MWIGNTGASHDMPSDPTCNNDVVDIYDEVNGYWSIPVMIQKREKWNN